MFKGINDPAKPIATAEVGGPHSVAILCNKFLEPIHSRIIPREAFFSTRAKAGTVLDGLLYDAGVLLSLALQYGTPATALAKSVARLEDGKPASPVGELIDVIVKEVEASNQSNSQGAADTDVQAEEGQAKERAWELFTG